MQTSVGFSGVRYIFPSCFFIILLHRFIHYSQVLTPLPRNIFRDAPDPGLDYHSAVFPHQGIGFSEQKHNQEGYLISTFFYTIPSSTHFTHPRLVMRFQSNIRCVKLSTNCSNCFNTVVQNQRYKLNINGFVFCFSAEVQLFCSSWSRLTLFFSKTNTI